MVSKRLTILLAALVLAGCAGQPALPPPVIDSSGTREADDEPASSVPVRPDAPLSRDVPDTDAATLALLRQSESALDAGATAEAIAYVERAIRLDPREPLLWIRLAELQIAQQNPDAAVQFANKAIALAGQRMHFVRDAWLVIADARAAQGDDAEAEAIRARWRTYRG